MEVFPFQNKQTNRQKQTSKTLWLFFFSFFNSASRLLEKVYCSCTATQRIFPVLPETDDLKLCLIYNVCFGVRLTPGRKKYGFQNLGILVDVNLWSLGVYIEKSCSVQYYKIVTFIHICSQYLLSAICYILIVVCFYDQIIYKCKLARQQDKLVFGQLDFWTWVSVLPLVVIWWAPSNLSLVSSSWI